jgi:hypothetical protein
MAFFLEADSTAALVSLLSPIAALGVNVVAQVMIVRGRGGTRFFRSIVEGFFTGLPALALGEFLALRSAGSPGLIVSVIVNPSIYVGLSYCYYAVASLGHASIRIRMYSEIAAEKGGKSMVELEELYREDTLIQLRLDRLTKSGDLAQQGGRYFVARTRLLTVANIIFAAKRILLGRRSEFE